MPNASLTINAEMRNQQIRERVRVQPVVFPQFLQERGMKGLREKKRERSFSERE